MGDFNKKPHFSGQKGTIYGTLPGRLSPFQRNPSGTLTKYPSGTLTGHPSVSGFRPLFQVSAPQIF